MLIRSNIVIATIISAIMFLSSNSSIAVQCGADIDCDEAVGLFDLTIMKTEFGYDNCTPCKCNPAYECPPYLSECNGICIDTSTDENNCGSCGTACKDWERCNDGTCVELECPPLYIEIDISAGPSASSYPVTGLSYQPALTDEYRTTKILLRKIDVSETPFRMGSPDNETGRLDNENIHQVTLTSNYYIGVFEITQKQYELIMDSTPSYYPSDNNPVEMVSWEEIRGGQWPGTPAGTGQPAAGTFIGILKNKTGLNFDLPTEAQWEYACRATTIRAFNDYTKNGGEGSDCTVPAGAPDPQLDPLARYWFTGGSTEKHAEVGLYQPNLWRLYDMHGNGWEWCLDWFSDSYPGDETDPTGASTGSYRLTRGGGWNTVARYCRSAYRGSSSSTVHDACIGFRLVLN